MQTINFDTWFGIGLGGGYFVNPKLTAMLASHGVSFNGVARSVTSPTRSVTGAASKVGRRRPMTRTARGANVNWRGDAALLNRIVTLTKTPTGIGKGELVKRLGIAPTVAEGALSHLRKEGRIKLEGKNRFARYYAAA